MGAVSEEVQALGRELSNWGRWGADDQRGTTNLITEDAIAHAASLVRRGLVFDLSIPLDASGPQPGGHRTNPIRLMSQTGRDQDLPGGFHFADDFVFMPLQAGTQWDALAHVYYGDAMWNGLSLDYITAGGAARNGIETQARGVVGRGVLLDIARHRGVEALAAGDAISASELDDVAAVQGVEIVSGDILLIRTGWWSTFLREQDRVAFMSAEPGLDLGCARWLRERDVAAVAADNWGVEVFEGEHTGKTLELHMVLIRDVGMTLGELFDLEALATDCAEDGVYEFFLTAPPLKFTGGVGSPVNPLAIK
ncbi:MAG: cyclase family protein [Marmoricola sp.]